MNDVITIHLFFIFSKVFEYYTYLNFKLVPIVKSDFNFNILLLRSERGSLMDKSFVKYLNSITKKLHLSLNLG